MKKFIAILMTIAVSGIIIAGCNSNAENADNAAPTNTEGGGTTE